MQTKDGIFNFLDKATDCLKSLTLNGRSILLSRKKTAFKGMFINIISLKNLATELLDTRLIDNMPTFRLSQDPLETLFGRIRSLQGRNDHLSVKQFYSAIRKLLVHNEITSSEFSNCMDQLKILTVSSLKPKGNESIEINELNNNDEEIASIRNDPFCVNDYLQNVYQDSTLVKMANDIEHKIKFIARFECANCMDVFDNNEKVSSDFYKCNPCLSTVLIAKVAYKFVNIFKNKRTINYDTLLEVILQKIDEDNIYPNFACEAEHKQYF